MWAVSFPDPQCCTIWGFGNETMERYHERYLWAGVEGGRCHRKSRGAVSMSPCSCYSHCWYTGPPQNQIWGHCCEREKGNYTRQRQYPESLLRSLSRFNVTLPPSTALTSHPSQTTYMNVATGIWEPTWDGCWWRKQVDWSQTCSEACLMDWREWRGRIWESWQIFPSWIGYSKTHPCSLQIYNHWESEETEIYCSLL